MAFNPMRGFRKHQKAWFAGLTILCMVTFVMCSGIGAGSSILESLGLMIGARSRGDVVASLYGKDIVARQIVDIRMQRRLASQYMDSVTATARDQVVQSVVEASSKWENQTRQVVQNINIFRQIAARNPQYRQGYLRSLAGTPPNYQDSLISQLGSLRRQFSDSKKSSDAILVGDLIKALRQELEHMLRPRGQLYFGGTTSLEDTLDFMIWMHEADRRGIQLTQQEINKLVDNEIDKRELASGTQRSIEESLRRYRNFSPETFRAALADEFRVRIAKIAVMGDERFDPRTTTATPYEFWQFYKDNRTENVVAVLPIPVRNKDFLAQVGQPTEKDLQELFEKHKDLEYQADSAVAAFKVPPKIEVEWVSANADSEKYHLRAAQVAELTQAGFQVMAGTGQTMSGSVAANALPTILPFAFETLLIDRYNRETYRPELQNASWTSPFNTKLHDTSTIRAENVAATLGAALGAAGTQVPTNLSALMSFRGSPYLYEAFDRGRIGTTMALAYSNPTPIDLAALTYYGTPSSPYVPLSAVKDEIKEKLQEELAAKLVQTDLAELQKKLTELTREKPDDLKTKAFNRPEIIASMLGQVLGSAASGAPMPLTTPLTIGPPAIQNYYQAAGREALAAVLAGPNPYPLIARHLVPLEKNRKAIDDAIARYGFQHGTTKKPEDRLAIGDDGGLKPFKEAFMRYRRFGEPKEKQFSDQFNQLFQNPASFIPQQWPLGGDSDQSFAYWKNNDKAAYVPSFEEVKDKVKNWWQFDKARELAKKEAEDLKAKAQAQTDAERWLKDGTKHSEPMFLLDGVAGLVKQFTPRPESSFNDYQPYRIPPEKIEYPPDGLTQDLLKLTEPGQVIIKSDKPKAIYYVMALVKRTPPSAFQFYREYQTGPEMLLGQMEQETNYRETYQRDLMDQLRQEARLKIDENNREKVDEKNRSDDS